jgi:hypothetical protein
MSCCRAPLWGPWPDFTFSSFYRKIAVFFVLGRPLCREDGSIICNEICQLQRTLNHILLSHLTEVEVKVEVTLRLRVSQSVCLRSEHPCGTCDQILLPVGVLLSEICGLIFVRRPLWREDGSAIYSVITQWSGSCRTCNHTLLSHLRLPQPGGPGSPRNMVAQLYPRALGSQLTLVWQVWGHVTTDGQSVSMSWRRALLGTCDQILILSEFLFL